MKLKVQQRLWEVKNAKNIDHSQRKATGCEWDQNRREPVWAATSKTIGMGPLIPFRIHIFPPGALHIGHGATKFNVYPAGFCSYFNRILFYPIPSFWNEDCLPCSTVFSNFITCFWFYRESQLIVCLESQKRLKLGLLKNAGTETLGDRIIAFAFVHRTVVFY